MKRTLLGAICALLFVYSPALAQQSGPVIQPGDILSFDTNGQLSSIHPGTSGNCLKTNGAGAVATWQSCGGGGGPTLAGTQTWTGTNTFNPASGPMLLLGPQSGTAANVYASYYGVNGQMQIQTSSTDRCTFGGNTVQGDDFELYNVAEAQFDFIDDGNNGFCVPSSNGPIMGGGGFIAGNGGAGFTYTGSVAVQHNGGASFFLGNSGAPSGACTNGSLYTRSDGSVGAALYVCYGAVWHADAT